MQEVSELDIESGVPFAVQTVELDMLLEDLVARRGVSAIEAARPADMLAVIEEIMAGEAVFDLDIKRLLELHKIATVEYAQVGLTLLSKAKRHVQNKAGLPDPLDIVSLAVNEATAQIGDMSCDIDNLVGPQTVLDNIQKRSAGIMSVAISATIFEDVVGSQPKKLLPLSRVMQLARHVQEGLVLIGLHEDDVDSRRATGIAVGVLEQARIDRLNSKERMRYGLFIDLLELSTAQTVIDFSNLGRKGDLNGSLAVVIKKATSGTEKFVKGLSDSQIATVVVDAELRQLVVDELVRDSIQEFEVTFATVATDLLDSANKGKEAYRSASMVAEVERSLKTDGLVISSNFASKEDIFMNYLPEIRKLAVIMGGRFDCIQAVYVAAANILDEVYQNAEGDEVVFPDPGDLYMVLAVELRLGAFASQTAGDIAALDFSDRLAMLGRLDSYYDLKREEQQDSGNCLGVDVELFFPGRGESTKEVKQVCAGCDEWKRETCLEHGLYEKHGIWGGESERGRRRVRRMRGIVGWIGESDDEEDELVPEEVIVDELPVSEFSDDLSDLDDNHPLVI